MCAHNRHTCTDKVYSRRRCGAIWLIRPVTVRIRKCSSRANEEFRRTDNSAENNNKETYLEQAVAINKKIAWFDITVKYLGRVKVFETSENLVEKHFDVFDGEWLRGDDDLVKVALHQFGDDISGGGGSEWLATPSLALEITSAHISWK